MEDSLNSRFDEVEQELIRLLSLRADDLQVFSSRQDQLLQSHHHCLSTALKAARSLLERIKSNCGVTSDEIRERWLERQNLKRFWVYCEEIQRQKGKDIIDASNKMDAYATTNSYNTVYQTPNQNDSNTNISTTSLSTLQDLSLD